MEHYLRQQNNKRTLSNKYSFMFFELNWLFCLLIITNRFQSWDFRHYNLCFYVVSVGESTYIVYESYTVLNDNYSNKRYVLTLLGVTILFSCWWKPHQLIFLPQHSYNYNGGLLNQKCNSVMRKNFYFYFPSFHMVSVLTY